MVQNRFSCPASVSCNFWHVISESSGRILGCFSVYSKQDLAVSAPFYHAPMSSGAVYVYDGKQVGLYMNLSWGPWPVWVLLLLADIVISILVLSSIQHIFLSLELFWYTGFRICGHHSRIEGWYISPSMPNVTVSVQHSPFVIIALILLLQNC